MEGVHLLGFLVEKSNMVGGGWWWYKPIIRYNSNSTLGGVGLTLSGDQVWLEEGWSWELSWSLTIIFEKNTDLIYLSVLGKTKENTDCR